MSEAQIKAAKDALNRGDKDSARDILEELINTDDRNAEVWFFLAQAVETSDDKGICLENVVTIDPDHTAGQAALAALKEGRDPFSDGDLFADAEDEFDAAFSGGDDEGFDVGDDAFDVKPDDTPEIVGRIERFANNRRLLIWLMIFFGVGALCMFSVAILLLT